MSEAGATDARQEIRAASSCGVVNTRPASHAVPTVSMSEPAPKARPAPSWHTLEQAWKEEYPFRLTWGLTIISKRLPPFAQFEALPLDRQASSFLGQPDKA